MYDVNRAIANPTGARTRTHTLSLTHTCFLSISFSLFHTCTRTQCVCWSGYVSRFLFLSCSPITHTHSCWRARQQNARWRRTLTHTQKIYTLFRSLTFSLSHTHTKTCRHRTIWYNARGKVTHTRTHSPAHTHRNSLTRTHTLSLFLSFSLSLSLSLSLSRALSLIHTHT